MDPLMEQFFYTPETHLPTREAQSSRPPSYSSSPRPVSSTTSSKIFLPSTGAIELSLQDFRSYIDEAPSLNEATILSVEGYCQKDGRATHRFVVLELSRRGGTAIWLRLERRLQSVPSLLQFMKHSRATRAQDRATLSRVKATLIAQAICENSWTFSGRHRLADLNHLLRIIAEELEQYNIWPENCWLFSSLILQHLAEVDPSCLPPITQVTKHIEMTRAVRNRVSLRLQVDEKNIPTSQVAPRRNRTVAPPIQITRPAAPNVLHEAIRSVPAIPSLATSSLARASTFTPKIPQTDDPEAGVVLLRMLDTLQRERLSEVNRLLVGSAQNSAKKLYARGTSLMRAQAGTVEELKIFYHLLEELAWSLTFEPEPAVIGDAAFFIIHARRLLPTVYPPSEAPPKLAESYFVEGHALYQCERPRQAVRALRKAISRCRELEPINNVRVLCCLAHSLTILSWAHGALNENRLALERALEAVQLADDGTRRFAPTQSSLHVQLDTVTHQALSDTWDEFILPMALSAATEAFCNLLQFQVAYAYGKRAAEFSRELFRTRPSGRTAEVFANALQLHEKSLATLGKSTELEQTCSPQEWRDMLAWLPDTTWEMHRFVAGRARSDEDAYTQ